MTDRDTFLDRIRERLQQEYHFPLRDPGPEVAKSPLRDDTPRPELIAHFTCMLEDVGGHVVRVADDAAACRWVVDFVQERDMGRAVVDGPRAPIAVPVGEIAAALAEAGLAVTVAPAGDTVGEAARQAFRRACADADVGVTGAEFAVGDTGTLVLLAGPGAPRTTSLMPPVHVALLPAQRILPNLSVLVARLRAEVWPHGMPGGMTLITGPSRTGDIEQTLSVGVHGPGEVWVVIIEGDL
jgi:L-lactate dehydrogenase complex protein LldG